MVLKKVKINSRTPIKKTTLLKHLILFDFFFIDVFSTKSASYFGSFNLDGEKKKIYILNLFEQYKGFKQFFRFLQFFKYTNRKKTINIIIPVKEKVQLLKELLSSFNFALINSSFANQDKRYTQIKLLLLLDYPTRSAQHIFNCVSRNKYYLVQSINSFFESNSLGYYKISNNFTNIKRLVFIGVVLKTLFK